MIVLNKKDYEIEETVQINKEDNVLYEFKMKITSEELGQIKEAIFSDENIKAQKQVSQLRYSGKFKEADKLEEEVGNKLLNKEEELKQIIFKEHLDKVLEHTNKYEFEKLYENIIAFFINAFVKEKTEPLSTTITELAKITQN